MTPYSPLKKAVCFVMKICAFCAFAYVASFVSHAYGLRTIKVEGLPSDLQEILSARDTHKIPEKFLKPPHVSFAHIKIQNVQTSKKHHFWLVENHANPIISAVFTFRRAGNKSEITPGTVDLLESMLFEGAGAYAKSAFRHFLIENNIRFSVKSTLDAFSFYFSVPKSSLPKAFEALSAMLKDLHLDNQDFTKVKNQYYIGYTQALESENGRARELLNNVFFGKAPYTSTIRQKRDALKNLSAIELHQFMKAHFTKDNMIVSVCGDTSAAEISTLLDSTLSFLPDVDKTAPLEDITFQNVGQCIHEDMDIPQTVIMFACAGFKRSDPSYFPLTLALDILASGELNSRLMMRIREEKGLVYGIGAENVVDDHAQYILGRTSSRASFVDNVIKEIQNTWQDFASKGITSNELDLAKKQMIGRFPLMIVSTSDIASVLNTMQYYDLGIDYLQTRQKEIENVTVERVNTALKLHMNHPLTFVTVGQRPHAPSKTEGESA